MEGRHTLQNYKSHHIQLYHITPHRIMTHHITRRFLVSYHAAPHRTTSHPTTLQHTLQSIKSRVIASYHTIAPHHTTLYRITSLRAPLHYITRLLVHYRSTFYLDPPLYTTIKCTVLKTESSTVHLIVVYRGGSTLTRSLNHATPQHTIHLPDAFF